MNISTIQELSKKQIMKLIIKGIQRKYHKLQPIHIPTTIANIFVEPSTRTLVSFKKAEKELGLKILDLSVEASSFQKGETLEDTLLNLEAIGIRNFVIRSGEDFYWKPWKYPHRFLNGGDGKSNHPTQALLDAMTIYEEFNRLNDLKVLIVGDVPHSRVAGSLKELMKKFNSKVDFFTPSLFNGKSTNLDRYLPNYDVIVMLRIQHERHQTKVDTANYNEKYGLNTKNINLLKDGAIFMHPGPINRDVEIASDLLYDHPKCRILQQVENGVFVRQAAVELLCKNL